MTTRLMAALVFAVVLSTTAAPAAGGRRTVELSVTKDGFVPPEVKVHKGESLKLVVTRTVERTCATEIVLEGTGIRRELPLGRAVEIEFTPAKSGRIQYACAMGMVGGVLLVD